MSEVVQVHVFVSGRVQGVGYRANTERQARHLNLQGWVRNLTDGRVEAVFEGPLPQVEAMVKWCRHGPLTAKVAQVEVSYKPPQGLTSFQVRF
uniref:acylphosphatase n=1 Tax=Cyanothece sp. (strain PCC 7425 / ATCC 29141) TaxID=395961 RepID=B8HYI5_CYAP4